MLAFAAPMSRHIFTYLLKLSCLTASGPVRVIAAQHRLRAGGCLLAAVNSSHGQAPIPAERKKKNIVCPW